MGISMSGGARPRREDRRKARPTRFVAMPVSLKPTSARASDAVPVQSLPPRRTRSQAPLVRPLDVRQVHTYYGNTCVERHLLHIDRGEIVTLDWSNGAGSTTPVITDHTMRSGSIPHEARVDQGARLSHGEPGSSAPEGRRIFPRMTVREESGDGCLFTSGVSTRRKIPDRASELFPVPLEREDQPGGTLSGGEQQMLAIGVLRFAYPKRLMLDEPSMGLAPMFVEKIFDIIREINEQGTTILLVEQNAHVALEISHCGYALWRPGSMASSATRQVIYCKTHWFARRIWRIKTKEAACGVRRCGDPAVERGGQALPCRTLGCSTNTCDLWHLFASCVRVRPARKRVADIEAARLRERDCRRIPGRRRCPCAAAEAVVGVVGLARATARVGEGHLYANAQNLLKKSVDQLLELRIRLNHGLSGIESGDEQTLAEIHKGVTVAQQIEACRKAKDAGIELSLTCILGSGGGEVAHTARVRPCRLSTPSSSAC